MFFAERNDWGVTPRDADGPRGAAQILEGVRVMAQGRIKKLTNKGFGFIATDMGELFFHASAVQGVAWEDLSEGQRVEFNIGSGPKGPRAEQVKVLD